jgi:hypothetical protein
MDYCEYGNEPYGSMEDGKLVEQPNDNQLLQKDSLLYRISYMPDITSKFRTFAMLVITNLQRIIPYVLCTVRMSHFHKKFHVPSSSGPFSYRPQTETKIKISHHGHVFICI